MTSSRRWWVWSGLMTSAVVVPVLCEHVSVRLHAQTPGAASASSVPSAIAIVGARIIDASGNAPFEGTVVIRGDRIAEVGRSVKPPDGARVIDGQGRTVMPGLVDLLVELPKGATDDAASRDALSRAMGAYLYAGVTTIVPVNLTAAEIDALRDKLLRGGIRGPRLAIAPGADRLVRGSANPASGTASALGDAQALMDWRQRNLTYVPELALAAPSDRRAPTPLLNELTPADASAAGGASGGGASGGAATGGAPPTERWKILADQSRGARDAGVRLAVGSGAGTGAGAAGGAGAASLPHGWATLLAARLLVDAGLTPLQAVTAATSGGAWTLGLQSDRGFLAVGQRADLVVVTGDPSANIADLERIERVFLGGDEIDRTAVRTSITRPASAPPTTETTAAAASSAPEPATTKGGRSARRGRGAAGAAGKRGASDPASAAAAGSSLATPDPNAAAGSSSSNAPTTPTAGTSAVPVAGAGAPIASPNAAAPGTPGAPTGSAAAPGAATSSSVAPNAAAPSTAAGAAANNPGGMTVVSAAAATTLVTDPLIDDFEGESDSSTLGRAWSSAGESATSSTQVVAGRVVKGLRDHALHLTARMGDARDSSARVSVKLSPDGRVADVSRFHGLRFDARGQGRYLVIFVSRGVSDGRYHESYFSGSPLWTPVSIPFASIGQTGNGQRVKWTGRDVVEIVFQIARDPGEMGWLELDNIRFY